MAINKKGKRKVTVLGRQYYWSVEDSDKVIIPDEGFVERSGSVRYLHIISANKKYIVHYRIPEPGDKVSLLVVEGPEFPRAPGAQQVEVPRWRHDSKPYPTADFVRRLIGWSLGLTDS